MRLQKHFHPDSQPLGLCSRCCQEYVAGQRAGPPLAAVTSLATIMRVGTQQVIIPLPVCGDHAESDAQQAREQQPRRQFLIAQPGGGIPPGLRG